MARPILSFSVLLSLSAMLQSCALPPPPLGSAPLVQPSAIRDEPGRPMSGLLKVMGPVQLFEGPLDPGRPMVGIPFDYKYKSVLTKDVTGYSFTVHGVQAPVGSPGYLVGRFAASWAKGDGRGLYEMWCFLPSVAGGKRKNICLLRDGTGIAAIAPTNKNPYIWYSFSPMTGSFDYVHAPELENREVVLPLQLVLEYRFDGWTDAGAKITEMAGGEKSRDFIAPFGPDGVSVINTFAGDLHVVRAQGASNSATVTWKGAQ